jgi:hypothetical protein
LGVCHYSQSILKERGITGYLLIGRVSKNMKTYSEAIIDTT